MNGLTHTVIGAAAPLPLVLAGADLGQVAVLSLVAAAASLGPDIDHPNATATKALGSAAHKAVHGLSKATRMATSTRTDRSKAAHWESLGRDPDHRGLTHTGVSAGVIGIAAFFVAVLPLGDALLALGAGWMVGHVVRRFAAAGCAAAGAVLGFMISVPAWMMALAIAGGWLSHVLADACTKAGVPLKWPMRHKGRRWGHTKLMGDHLASGSSGEWVVAVAIVSILAFPSMAILLGNMN